MPAPQLGLPTGLRQNSSRGRSLTRNSSLLCFCVSIFAASSCSWDSDKSCLNCSEGTEKKKKKQVNYALWPRKAFLCCNISKRPWWHHLLICLLMPAQIETAVRQKSYTPPRTVDSISIQLSLTHHLANGLPNLGVCNPDCSKHLHPFLSALQRCSSPGHSPNPQNTDGW